MMINITFPDGSVRSYEQGVTGFQIAESISPALKFDDEQGKHTFWHTSAHLLAEALQELYPGIQFGFGPAVENIVSWYSVWLRTCCREWFLL